MTGELFGVGVGPGDPELLTLQAVRIIQSCQVLAAPKAKEGEGSSLQIVRAALHGLENKELLELELPMTRDPQQLEQSWHAAAMQLAQRLRAGYDVAFLTLGDPSIYSTYAYLHNRVKAMGLPCRLIAGVPSFCAAAARLNRPLVTGGEPLHIVPASYHGAEEGIALEGVRVLMKAGRSFPAVRRLLEKKGLLGRASMVERCGMEGERVYPSLEQAQEQAHYLSIIFVQEGED